MYILIVKYWYLTDKMVMIVKTEKDFNGQIQVSYIDSFCYWVNFLPKKLMVNENKYIKIQLRDTNRWIS